MTLSRFLRDYLYIPLGGSRKGPWRRHANLRITMVLGGLWHGAAWTFVLWGGFHGLLLLINHGWRAIRTDASATSVLARISCVAMTFLAVVLGWVLFRSETVAAALCMFQSMFDIGAALDSRGPSLIQWSRIVAALAAAFLLPNTYEIFAEVHPMVVDWPAAKRAVWLRWRPTAAWAFATACCICSALVPVQPKLSFLYFQF